MEVIIVSICSTVTGVTLKQRNVELAQILGDMDFILYIMYGGALVERMLHFKYLGLHLYQTDNYWPVIRWKIKRTWNY